MRFFGRIGAGGALDFDRCVIEIELFLQPRLDALNHQIDLRRVACHRMEGHHAARLGDGPRMDVVDVLDADPGAVERVRAAFGPIPLRVLEFRKDDSFWDAIEEAGLLPPAP